jgi:hypothetical protein
VAVRRTTEFVSTDLFSSVLRELRFASAAYRWLEPGRPFDLDFDSPGLRGVHIIAEGRCDLVLARLSDALPIRALRQHSAVVDQPGWLAGLRDPCVAAALEAMHRDLAHPWSLPALASWPGCLRLRRGLQAGGGRVTGRRPPPRVRLRRRRPPEGTPC